MIFPPDQLWLLASKKEKDGENWSWLNWSSHSPTDHLSIIMYEFPCASTCMWCRDIWLKGNFSSQDWSQFIFSNESKFQLYKSNGQTYMQRSVGETLDPKCDQQTVKHGGGNVMVWGAFTFLGVSELSRISHWMKVADYVQLLENSLLPFLHRFPEGEKFSNMITHQFTQPSKPPNFSNKLKFL